MIMVALAWFLNLESIPSWDSDLYSWEGSPSPVFCWVVGLKLQKYSEANAEVRF